MQISFTVFGPVGVFACPKLSSQRVNPPLAGQGEDQSETDIIIYNFAPLPYHFKVNFILILL